MAAGSLLLCLLWIALKVTQGYFFEPGYTHHYTYSSTTDTLGMHNITTVIRFQIRDVNHTGSHSLYELKVDSFTQHSQRGYYADNPMKWNLSRHFLFELGETGLVHFVHYHPEDKEEVITLKKAVVGTISAHFQVSGKDRWTYTSNELDHGGHLLHTYEGQKMSDGHVLTRYHYSDANVIRTHRKVLHYNTNGMIHRIHLVDNITTYNTKDSTVHNGLHDNGAIKIYSSGEFPTIQTIGETHVTFQQKK
ncbi:uncharacterized protein LOC133171992 [Saccostrea echinata]|uniref:uncharacterized protein LOC133171992 n=1 Tax=Saccostrea echinata TaxID=191078 RepID=UPI002A81016E|nr:uncharacterized protein LOC133171992 [Saccostrea echinata]